MVVGLVLIQVLILSLWTELDKPEKTEFLDDDNDHVEECDFGDWEMWLGIQGGFIGATLLAAIIAVFMVPRRNMDDSPISIQIVNIFVIVAAIFPLLLLGLSDEAEFALWSLAFIVPCFITTLCSCYFRLLYAVTGDHSNFSSGSDQTTMKTTMLGSSIEDTTSS